MAEIRLVLARRLCEYDMGWSEETGVVWPKQRVWFTWRQKPLFVRLKARMDWEVGIRLFTSAQYSCLWIDTKCFRRTNQMNMQGRLGELPICLQLFEKTRTPPSCVFDIYGSVGREQALHLNRVTR